MRLMMTTYVQFTAFYQTSGLPVTAFTSVCLPAEFGFYLDH